MDNDACQNREREVRELIHNCLHGVNVAAGRMHVGLARHQQRIARSRIVLRYLELTLKEPDIS
jgi:hypothetical protein